MVRTEAVQIAAALEPEPSGWDSHQDEAEAAVETAADAMLDAGMHPTLVEELLGNMISAIMGEMG